MDVDTHESVVTKHLHQASTSSSPRRSVEPSVDQPPCGSRSESAQVDDLASVAMEESDPEDQPLWERVAKIEPAIVNEPRQRSPSPMTVYEPVQPTPPPPPRPPPTRQRIRSKTVWIKGSFPPKIANDTVETFIRGIFEPLGKIFSLKFHARSKGLIDLRVTIDAGAAEQAEKVIHGRPFPQCNSWPLYLSSRYTRGVGVLKALRNKLKKESTDPKLPVPAVTQAPTIPKPPKSKFKITVPEHEPYLSDPADAPPPPPAPPRPPSPAIDAQSPPPFATKKPKTKTSSSPSSKRPVTSPSSAIPYAENCKTDNPAWSLIDSTTRETQDTANVRGRSKSTEARSATPSEVVIEQQQQKRSPKTHRSWPFEPAPMYLDESTSTDFPRTLNDFLTTFFRLWKNHDRIFDTSTMIGRKASAITKSTGWSSIYKSISRLPALSNDPMPELIIDASLSLLILSELSFPKSVRRAFDRTLILRPVDVHLHPSEGCLGLLKWIILSDTLTIRKHSIRTTLITDGFKEIQKSQACSELGSDYHQAREVFQESIRSSRRQSFVGGELHGEPEQQHQQQQQRGRARSSSSHLRVHSSNDSPHSPRKNQHRSSKIDPPTESVNNSLRSGSENVALSAASEYERLQTQLRAMQQEIENLKSLTRTVKSIDSTNPHHQEDQTPRIEQSMDEGEAGIDNNRRTGFTVVDSRSSGHIGFGVSKKRLLLSTDLGKYIVISMRGDILTWDPIRAPHVELVRSGASPTDIIDSACYHQPSSSIVIGNRSLKSLEITIPLMYPQLGLSGGHDGKVFATDLSQAFHHTLILEENADIYDIQTNPLVQDTIMVTTANKAPGSQFRYCDLRTPARPVLSFGVGGPTTTTTTSNEPAVKYHRKGSLRDYMFSYPNADPSGRSLVIGSSSEGGLATQTLFENSGSLVVLQKQVLSQLNIVEEFIS
ncbi:hypothetical protein KEM48_009987 [Puccinia striiformis f. sp. tritici PST-130]|nr:hypothetical protein KEM48_009987 [Puccinia striiformis f. sp. tritici PST-130]